MIKKQGNQVSRVKGSHKVKSFRRATNQEGCNKEDKKGLGGERRAGRGEERKVGEREQERKAPQ